MNTYEKAQTKRQKVLGDSYTVKANKAQRAFEAKIEAATVDAINAIVNGITPKILDADTVEEIRQDLVRYHTEITTGDKPTMHVLTGQACPKKYQKFIKDVPEYLEVICAQFVTPMYFINELKAAYL